MAIAVSLVGRASVGGDINNLIPGFAFLCTMPGFLRVSGGLSEGRVRRLSYGLIALQLVFTFVNPLMLARPSRTETVFVPTKSVREKGDRLLDRLRFTEGPIWMMMHPSLAVFAGKRPFAHVQTLWHARHRGADPLPDDLVRLLQDRHFASIISDESEWFEKEPALQKLLRSAYRGRPLPQPMSPSTLSGVIVQPSVEYLPTSDTRRSK